MVQYWETSDITDNCLKGPLDEPYFIPIKRTDLIGLRLQIPYHLITLNGGGLPTAVTMSIVDNIGTTTLCSYSGKFKLGYLNDGGNRIAEYQILATLPLNDEVGGEYQFLTFDVVSGDVVELTYGGNTYSFCYGIDDVPYPLIEWSPGKICFGEEVNILAALSYKKNNTPVNILSSYLISGAAPSCAHEDFDCFRFKVSVILATYGHTMTYYTKPFKVLRCDDEETLFIEGTYTSGSIDCAGQEHLSGGATMSKNKLYTRIFGEITDMPSEVKAEYNARNYCYRSSLIKKYLLKGLPIPMWMVRAFETIVSAQVVKFNGIEYSKNDVNSYLENIDINGMTYQNINLPLQSSKCEIVFVC
jgi:hypothetical protein